MSGHVRAFFALNLSAFVLLGLVSCVQKTSRKLGLVGATPLLVVHENLYDGGWKCRSEIRVGTNGVYTWEIPNRDKPNGIFTGQLSPFLTTQLGELVRTGSFGVVEGVPTYECYPDDSHHSIPKPILKLCETVMSRHDWRPTR